MWELQLLENKPVEQPFTEVKHPSITDQMHQHAQVKDSPCAIVIVIRSTMQAYAQSWPHLSRRLYGEMRQLNAVDLSVGSGSRAVPNAKGILLAEVPHNG